MRHARVVVLISLGLMLGVSAEVMAKGVGFTVECPTAAKLTSLPKTIEVKIEVVNHGSAAIDLKRVAVGLHLGDMIAVGPAVKKVRGGDGIHVAPGSTEVFTFFVELPATDVTVGTFVSVGLVFMGTRAGTSGRILFKGEGCMIEIT